MLRLNVTKITTLKGTGVIRKLPEARYSVVCATFHAHFEFMFIQNCACKNV